MSTRGLKFQFEPGELVLCFEPDPTKARVLYHAKILKVTSSRDKKGRRRPEYQIHFQGWNSSWDRIVPDSFVLKNDEPNRNLMRRLAEVARNMKKNRSRKRRIEGILKAHFKAIGRHDSDSDTSEDTEEEEESSEEEETDQDEETETDGNKSTEEETEEESDDDDTPPSDGLDMKGPRNIELDIPDNLRLKLEDDCYFLMRKNKLLKLPAEPNVITIIEGYVKNFALNIFYAAAEKQLRTREPPAEKNVDLCKEVMDGIRIFFDFTLSDLLLYNVERAQFTKLHTSVTSQASPRRNSEPLESPLSHSCRLRSSAQKGTPLSPEVGEPPVKYPRLSPKKDKNEDMSDDETPRRRMTRHAYAEEIRQIRAASTDDAKNTNIQNNSKNTEQDRNGQVTPQDGRRRASLRSSRQTTDSSFNTSGSHRTLSDRVSPPPPLLLSSSGISSKSSTSPHNTPTRKSMCSLSTAPDSVQMAEKEGALNSVLSWKLIPDDVYEQKPTPPSLIYGAHHLLRMFVKMPELVGQMALPDVAVKPLLRHFKLFLEYLSEHCDELFPSIAYIDQADVDVSANVNGK